MSTRPHTRSHRPQSKTKDLQTLSLASLRVELHRRHQPTTGTRRNLQARLRPLLTPTSKLTVPFNFPSSPSIPTPPLPTALLLPSRVLLLADNIPLLRARLPIGKGHLSRSAPTYANPTADPKGRAARQLAGLQPPSDRPLNRDHVEYLQLMPEEAYHAAYKTSDLNLREMRPDGTLGGLVDDRSAWRRFRNADVAFPPRYAAYCKYRAAGWVPRSGLKYGVDWVLYPSSVSRKHSHAPFCVVLCLRRVEVEREWIALQNRLRLVKNVNKALVVAVVEREGDGDGEGAMPGDAFRVRELTVDRWLP